MPEVHIYPAWSGQTIGALVSLLRGKCCPLYLNGAPTFDGIDLVAGGPQLQLGDEGAVALAAVLEGSRTITAIKLASNSIGDEGATSLAAMLSSSSITCLNLSDNSIGAKGAASLAGALSRTLITALVLRGNSIGYEGTKTLCAAISNSRITCLDLGSNSIGDEGAAAMSAVLSSSSITALNLSDNSIGHEGVASLAGVLSRSLIIVLVLSGNSFLERYELRGHKSSISGKGTTALSEALSSSHIARHVDLGIRSDWNSDFIGDGGDEAMSTVWHAQDGIFYQGEAEGS